MKDLKLIERAFKIGLEAHEGQKRQSGEPYFTHPIAVAKIVSDLGGDTETIIAALLHDTVEDTPLTLADIEKEFGSIVTGMIDGLTKLNESDLPLSASLDEKIETLRKIFTLMQKDVRIMVVKLADRVHNMQTLGYRTPEKQQEVAKETMDVYVKIADRLCMRDMRDDLEEMCLTILEPEVLKHLQETQKQNEERSKPVITKMQKALHHAFADFEPHMEFEAKSWEKLRRQYLSERERTSTPGITVAFVCDTIDECYQTLGRLHQLWRREILTFEDFINAPVFNGYKGVHTTILLDDGTRVRCKIRTKDMHAYAHAGISLVCFDNKEKGLLEYLPWASRINPLSSDTEDRSEDFWQSLQSDILGEAILIHGSGDETILLPKGASALDAVFYLHGEKGLQTTEIFVNGNKVPFHEHIAHASTVDAHFSDRPQVDLSWLQYVHTGIGTAAIRKGLAKEEREVKISTGQLLLQEHLTKHRRVFIREFNAKELEQILQKRGFATGLDEMYIRLAEGRLQPQQVEAAIYQRNGGETAERKKYFLQTRLHLRHWKAFGEILQFYKVTDMHVKRDDSDIVKYDAQLMLTPKESEALMFILQQTPELHFSMTRYTEKIFRWTAAVVLFILWGIDPVIAHMLLRNGGIEPLDLTSIRFLSLMLLSGFMLYVVRRNRPLPEARLSLRNPSLWLSALFLVGVSITTYYSLEGTLPLHYTIPMTAAGVSMTSIVNRQKKMILAATWLLILSGVYLLFVSSPDWRMDAIAFTFLAVICFTGFSYISEQYKRMEQVSLRTAQYLFLLSTLCAIISLPLLLFTDLTAISVPTLISAVLFSIFITGLPYYIYYYLLSHKEIDFVLRYSMLLIPLTLIGQGLLVTLPTTAAIASAILVAAGAVLPIVTQKKV